MPTFLSDPQFSLYLVLTAAACIAGAVWLNRRTRRRQAAFAGVAAVGVAVLLIDLLYESPREAAVRGVREISHAINDRDWTAFEARIAKDFKYRTTNRAALREQMANVVTRYDARTAVWEFNRDKVREIGDNEIEIVFDAKGDPKSGMAYYAHFRTTFVREADGQWRMKSLAVYNYASKTNGPEEFIPGIE
jgi:hypothetical protein